MKKLVSLLLVMVLLATLALSVSAQEEPVSGGTLRIAVGSITSLDPTFIQDDMSFYAASQVYNTLVRSSAAEGGGFEPIPDLAESWDVSDDGTTITFHLRHGMMFQDGNAVFPEGESREVVAADVVYSIERFVNTDGASVPSDFASVYELTEAIDDYTVQLNLSAPDGLLFANARGISAAAIYPHEAVEQLGDDFSNNPIGSGPFEFVEFVPDDRVVLQRNEDYYITPNLDQVIFQIIPDTSVEALTLEAGEVDMAHLVSDLDIPSFRDNPDFVLYDQQLYWSAAFLVFDMNVELFQNQDLRKAVALAIDGNNIIRAVYPETAIDGCGMAGPGWPGYDPELCAKYFYYAPDESRALLEGLGYTDSNGNGIYDMNGEDLVIPIEGWNLPEMPRVLEAVVSQLNAVGIGTDLQIVEFGTWIDDYTNGPRNLMASSGFGGYGGMVSYWGPGGYGEGFGIVLEDAQALLAEAATLVNPADTDPLIYQAQQIVFGEYYSISLGFQTGYAAYSSKVHDFGGINWWMNLVTDRNNVWLSQ